MGRSSHKSGGFAHTGGGSVGLHGIVSRKYARQEAPNAAGSMCGHTSNSSVRPLAKRRAPFTPRARGARRPENPWWFALQKDRESGRGPIVMNRHRKQARNLQVTQAHTKRLTSTPSAPPSQPRPTIDARAVGWFNHDVDKDVGLGFTRDL